MPQLFRIKTEARASAFPSRLSVFISQFARSRGRTVVKLPAKSILRSRFGWRNFGFRGGSWFFSRRDGQVTLSQFLCVRQLVEVPKPEVFQEKLGGFVEQGASRHFRAPRDFY